MAGRRGWAVALLAGALTLTACTSGGPSTPPSSATGTSSSAAPSTTPASTTAASPADPAPADWPAYHGDALRTGVSATMPPVGGTLHANRVALDGTVYASPVVVGATVVAATEGNSVYGLSPTGAQRWHTQLGDPAPLASLPCGNIDPLGITGTPVVDVASGTVYVVASIGTRVRHDLVALDLATGAIRWRRTVDLPGVDAQAMQQRGALTILDGRVWVPFGGLAGDCGAYKGRLVGVPLAGGEPVAYTVPTTREAGIWTPPGATVFDGRLFVAVGNGESVGRPYDYSDSVLELAGIRLVDSFSPGSWADDNRTDLDLGSQGPAVVQGRWIFIAGKSKTGYVLRLGRLGGIGGEVSQAQVCGSYGGTAVQADTVYVPCDDGVRAVRISDTGALSVRWHAAATTTGSPVVGGGRLWSLDPPAGVLHALDPATGAPREQVTVGTASRFATPAISGSRLYVPTLTGLSIVETAR